MRIKSKAKIAIIISICFLSISFNSNNANAKYDKTDCKDNFTKLINAKTMKIASVHRMCGNIGGEGYLGVMWADSTASNDYAEGTAPSKTEYNIKDTDQNLTLHGYVVFDDNKTNSYSALFAIHVKLMKCNDITKTTDDGYTIYACNDEDGAEEITKGITWDQDIKNGEMGHYVYRGIKEENDRWSTGGYETIKINTKTIRDNYYNNQTGDVNIMIYRCMAETEWENYRGKVDPYKIGERNLYKGSCGFDPSIITIKNEDTEETVTMKTGVKLKDETNYDYNEKNKTVEVSGKGDKINAIVYFKHITEKGKNPTGVTVTTNGSDEAHEFREMSKTDDGRYYYIYRVTLKLGYEESKKVCESVTFRPKTYINDIAQDDSGATKQTCVTVKRTDTKEVKNDNGNGYVYHEATDFTIQGLNNATEENGIYNFASNYTSPINIAFKTTLSIGNQLPQNVKDALDAQGITDYQTIKYSYSTTEISNGTGTSVGEDKTINIPQFILSPGQSKEICAELKIDPSQYYYEFSSSETIINGTSQGKKYTITPYENESVTRTKCVTVYRKTEINTSTSINLKTKSTWQKPDESYDEISSTVDNNDSRDITDKEIYVESKNNKSLKLDYIYTLNYNWLSGTTNNRRYSLNTINWWSKDDPLGSYSLDASSESGSENELEPDIEIKNISGNTQSFANNQKALTVGSYTKYCRSAVAPAIYEAGYQSNPTDKGVGESRAEICAHIYRPWNYNLSFTSIKTDGVRNGQVFLNGGSGSIKIVAEVNNENNYNSDSEKGDPNQVGNASYSPATEISLYSFTINSDNPSDTDFNNAIMNNTSNRIEYSTETFNPENSKNIIFSNVSVSGSTGTHLCFYATMNYTNSANDTANTYYGTPTQHMTYSKPTCFTITSIPTAQIHGGSLYAEGNVEAKVQFAGTGLFGSWVDYGLISNGTVSQFASGKAIDQTKGYDEETNKNHPLTIANHDGSILISKGKANISSSATKSRIVSLYSNPSGIVASIADNIDISNSDNYTKYTSNQYTTQSNNSNAKYRYTKVSSKNRITQSSALNAGITHVIYSDSNITIDSNILYEDDQNNPQYAQITDIPQFIIIAKGDINIEKDVTEINAWLIADGTINTCTEDGSTPNSFHQSTGVYYKGICDKALTVNGPVFAKNILLERTGISSTSKATEVFNITAANYYWAFAKAKENGKTSIVYTRSLAPRY